MKLLTVAQMQTIEKAADSSGWTYAQMMSHAGRGVAHAARTSGRAARWTHVLGLVGPGNNGGDTLVALTELVRDRWHATAWIMRPRIDDPLVAALRDAGGEVLDADAGRPMSAQLSAIRPEVILDGLLGTGFRLPLRREYASAMRGVAEFIANAQPRPFVIAVDCPSGVDCDLGACADETLHADLTVTMAAAKIGLVKLPAFARVGELTCAPIGPPEYLPSLDSQRDEVADDELVSSRLPVRGIDSHKGSFGTALIVAGSSSYTGAALLAGSAAYRVGVGLVQMAIPDLLHAALAAHLPEATWINLPQESGFISAVASETLLKSIGRATAILIGPGLGSASATGTFMQAVLGQIKLPLVIDADGLRHLAAIKDWQHQLHGPAVLTPHPGEMSELCGLSRDEIQFARIAIAKKFSAEWGHVVVLKGALTVVAEPGGRATIIPIATPALARAGTGDVLAGMIVGLRAQGLDAYDAARAGAYLHGHAGLLAAKNLGTNTSVLASDVLNAIPHCLAALHK